MHYRSGRDVEQAPRLFARSPGLTLLQICSKVPAALPLALQSLVFHPLGRAGRDHGPLGFAEVAAVQVETERHFGERPLAFPLHKAGLDSRQITGAVAIAAVDDEAVGVEQDRLAKPVLLNVGGELLEGLAGEQRKKVRHRMKLVHHGCSNPSTSIMRNGCKLPGRGAGVLR